MKFAISSIIIATSVYRISGEKVGKNTEEALMADKYKAIYLLTHSAGVFYNFIEEIEVEIDTKKIFSKSS